MELPHLSSIDKKESRECKELENSLENSLEISTGQEFILSLPLHDFMLEPLFQSSFARFARRHHRIVNVALFCIGLLFTFTIFLGRSFFSLRTCALLNMVCLVIGSPLAFGVFLGFASPSLLRLVPSAFEYQYLVLNVVVVFTAVTISDFYAPGAELKKQNWDFSSPWYYTERLTGNIVASLTQIALCSLDCLPHISHKLRRMFLLLLLLYWGSRGVSIIQNPQNLKEGVMICTIYCTTAVQLWYQLGFLLFVFYLKQLVFSFRDRYSLLVFASPCFLHRGLPPSSSSSISSPSLQALASRPSSPSSSPPAFVSLWASPAPHNSDDTLPAVFLRVEQPPSTTIPSVSLWSCTPPALLHFLSHHPLLLHLSLLLLVFLYLLLLLLVWFSPTPPSPLFLAIFSPLALLLAILWGLLTLACSSTALLSLAIRTWDLWFLLSCTLIFVGGVFLPLALEQQKLGLQIFYGCGFGFWLVMCGLLFVSDIAPLCYGVLLKRGMLVEVLALAISVLVLDVQETGLPQRNVCLYYCTTSRQFALSALSSILLFVLRFLWKTRDHELGACFLLSSRCRLEHMSYMSQ